MEKIIELVGNIAAIIGIIFCTVSGFYRLIGHYNISNLIHTESIFLLGVGMMVFACLVKLHLLSAGNKGTG